MNQQDELALKALNSIYAMKLSQNPREWALELTWSPMDLDREAFAALVALLQQVACGTNGRDPYLVVRG
jgi:hypothetical protein